MSLIAGVDPGKTGAIAFLETDSRALSLHVMPMKEGERSRDLDRYLLAQLFELYAPSFVVVEEVSAMVYTDSRGEIRGQGAAASFNFGMGYGSILGVLAALQLPVWFVKPAVWKMLLGLSSDKNRSRKLAAELFPADAARFSRKKDDGFAEAALLAHFGATRFGKKEV